MFFSMNEEKKKRRRAAAGVFANLKEKCEMLAMTGWNQTRSSVPCALHRSSVKFPKQQTHGFGIWFFSLSLPPSREPLMHAAHRQVQRSWVAGDLFQYLLPLMHACITCRPIRFVPNPQRTHGFVTALSLSVRHGSSGCPDSSS